MKKHLLLLMAVCVLVLPAQAQKKQSWKSLKKEADAFLSVQEYEKAAKAYELAFESKSKKTELIYSAAEAYYKARNYKKAAAAYKQVVDDTKSYPLANLNYARALKSEGNYDQAIRALRNLSNSYSGAGKEKLDMVIQREMVGAQLASSMVLTEGTRVIYPGEGINSDEDEFAPTLLADILLFSSTRNGKATVLSATPEANGNWEIGGLPDNFPRLTEGHFGNTALSPNGNTLYFTICDASTSYRVKESQCAIYYVTRNGDIWGKPEKLPAPINKEGTNNTHPAVMQNGSLEVLYFSSNRPGGSGEMDIWFATRNLNTSVFTFSNPVNLGAQVNSIGDDITPFYDPGSQTLYFSTNGHPSIGGFDVYMAKGNMQSWGKAAHAGKPINSPADDYYYNFFGPRAFIASNRKLSGLRNGTTNDDIFGFVLPGRPVTLAGQVMDQQTQTPLLNASVTVYESGEAGRSLIGTQTTSNGEYRFEVQADKSYAVEITSPDYQPGSYTVSTTDINMDTYGQPVYLDAVEEKEPASSSSAPSMTDEITAGALPILDDSGTEYTAKGINGNDNLEYISKAPRYQGRYYKIQLIATRKGLPSLQPRISHLEDMGRFDTEYLIRSKLTRILIGDFFSEAEAYNALDRVQSSGYATAFVVQYEDGVRFGRINL